MIFIGLAFPSDSKSSRLTAARTAPTCDSSANVLVFLADVYIGFVCSTMTVRGGF